MEVNYDPQLIVALRDTIKEGHLRCLLADSGSQLSSATIVTVMRPKDEDGVRALHKAVADVLYTIEVAYAAGIINPEAVQQWTNQKNAQYIAAFKQ